MTRHLTPLGPEVRQELSLEFRRDGSASFDPTPYELPPPREIDVESLQHLIIAAMERFGSQTVRADGWLASRVHASLRLTRREAASPNLWRGIGVSVAPEYVRWRFPDPEKGTPINRFVGAAEQHAVGRLWWGAEFLRNGPSYELVSTAFDIQDIPNSFGFDFFHNRPMALASVRLLSAFRSEGRPATGRQANRLFQAANLMLTTTALDSLAPDSGPDPHAMRDWIRGRVDDTVLVETVDGPDEEHVPEHAIIEAMAFLRHVSDQIGLRAEESVADHPASTEGAS